MQSSHEQLLSAIGELSTSPHESALILIGDVGIGKSTLLEEAHRREPTSTSLVRINPGEASWPLSGVSAVVAGLHDPQAALRMPLPEDGNVMPLAEHLAGMLRGREHPRVTVLVDNIDLLDDSSRQLIGHLCSHLAGTGVCIVGTAVQLHSDEPLAGVKRLVISPLDDTSSERLAPRNIHTGTLRLLNWSTDRNPAALLGRVEELDDEQLTGREPLAFPLPPGRPAPAAPRGVRAVSPRGAPHRQPTAAGCWSSGRIRCVRVRCRGR